MQSKTVKRWKILVTSESNADTLLVVEKPEVTVGRLKDCDIAIKGEGISRKHLKLICKAEGLFAQDLGSANGVTLRKVRLTANKDSPISVGDRLFLGNGGISILIQHVDYVKNEKTSFDQDESDWLAPAKKSAKPDIREAQTKQSASDIPALPPPSKTPPKPLPPSKAPSTPPSKVKSSDTNVDILLQKNKHQEELDALKKQITNAQVDLEKAKSEILTLGQLKQSEIEKYKKESEFLAQTKAAEKTALESEIEGLKKKNLEVQKELADSKLAYKLEEARKTIIEKDISEKQQSYQSLLSDIEKQSAALKTLNESFEKTQLDLAQKNAEIKSVEEQWEQSKKSYATKEVELKQNQSSLEEQIHTTQKNLESLSNEFKDFLDKKTKETEEYALVQKKRSIEIASLEAEHRLTEARGLTQVEEKRNQLVVLQRDVSQVEATLADLNKKNSELNTEYNKTLTDLAQKKDEFALLSSNVNKESNLLHNTESKVAATKSELNKLSAKYQSLENEIQELLKKKDVELDDLKRAKEKSAAEIKAAKDEFAQWKAAEEKKIEQLAMDREAANKKQLEDAKRANHMELSRHKAEQVNALNKERAKLQSELAEQKKKIELQFEDWKRNEVERIHGYEEATKEACDQELAKKRQEFEAQLVLESNKHKEELARQESEALQARNRADQLRESVFLDGVVSTIRQSLKEESVTLDPMVAERIEIKSKALLKSLYMTTDEASLKALQSDASWLAIAPKHSLWERWKGPATKVALALGFVGIINSLVRGVPHLREWGDSQEAESKKTFEQKLALQRAEANRRYEAPQDDVFKKTYTENILSLTQYESIKSSEEFQKEFVLKVNAFFTKEIPGGDRKAPSFLAAEAHLVNELLDLRITINAKNPNSGIERMKQLESASMEKIYDLAGTPKQFERIRKIEEELYREFLSKPASELRTPASK